MGDEKVENKDLEGALEDFEKAAALKVPFPDLFFRIGSAYRVLENSEKAETALKHAIQLNGRYVKARLLLADLYGSLNQTDQAIHEYQLLYDQDVMHDEERYMMGMRFIDEGDMTKACEALKESFQEKPDRVHVHFVKAKKLFNQKEYAGAIDELNQAMAENRDYPDMYNFLGIAYFRKESYDDAEKAFRKSMELNRNYLDPKLNLAFLFETINQKENAREMFQEVLSIEPGNVIAHDALKSLGRGE